MFWPASILLLFNSAVVARGQHGMLLYILSTNLSLAKDERIILSAIHRLLLKYLI